MTPEQRFPPLGLYVHLPWCIRKCPYCDFNSHAAAGALPEAAYVDALLADLDCEAPAVNGREIRSVFIGGGTPSLFSAGSVGRLLEAVARRLSLAADCEVSLEANPGASERQRFLGYRSAGVTRLSLGVQSFDDGLLQAIGRVHDGQAAVTAVRAALSAGFAEVNVDLMYALPGQSPAQAEADATTACALGPSHLSHYQLTIEPNTLFAARPPRLPDEDRAAEAEARARERMRAAGYTQYEVSAFAEPGRECRHNLNYWTFGDYLGVGAGAHGKLSDLATGTIARRVKIRDPGRYLQRAGKGAATAAQWSVAADDLVFEFALNALRLSSGFSFTLYETRTGLPRSTLETGLQRGTARGLLRRKLGGVQLTDLGRRFLDDAVAGFIPDDSVGNS